MAPRLGRDLYKYIYKKEATADLWGEHQSAPVEAPPGKTESDTLTQGRAWSPQLYLKTNTHLRGSMAATDRITFTSGPDRVRGGGEEEEGEEERNAGGKVDSEGEECTQTSQKTTHGNPTVMDTRCMSKYRIFF